jgi:alanine dehydrogenase
LSYGLALAEKGLDCAMESDPALARGLNVRDGKIRYKAVAEAFNMECAV